MGEVRFPRAVNDRRVLPQLRVGQRPAWTAGRCDEIGMMILRAVTHDDARLDHRILHHVPREVAGRGGADAAMTAVMPQSAV